jgi:hypothetical protein
MNQIVGKGGVGSASGCTTRTYFPNTENGASRCVGGYVWPRNR